MPGAGSGLDRNDHELLTRMTQQISRLADELERLNDTLEGETEDDDDG